MTLDIIGMDGTVRSVGARPSQPGAVVVVDFRSSFFARNISAKPRPFHLDGILMNISPFFSLSPLSGYFF